jgi:hypothetical protein
MMQLGCDGGKVFVFVSSSLEALILNFLFVGSGVFHVCLFIPS